MSIPNNIILTWKNRDVPNYIIDNIARLNPDKDISFYDDEDIRIFLSDHYAKKYLDFFNEIKLGYNKGDFFRYCYLYKFGGYYCDIDIEHQYPISEIIEDRVSFFTIISAMLPRNHIFQALLFCGPQNKIIHSCIDDMLYHGPNPPIKSSYIGHTTKCMYDNITDYLGSEPHEGIFINGDEKIQFGQEYLNKDTNRYVCTYDRKLIAYSRYENYNREMGFLE
jgi:hypothetical protein